MKIQIDTREPAKIQRLAKKVWEAEELEFKTLPVGDIVCGNICIERKTVEDWLNSLTSGHLQKQVIQMQENYNTSYIIISGTFKNLFFRKNITTWTIDQWLGSLASVSARSKVKILQVDNDTQLMKLCKKLFDKHSDGKVFDITNTELLKNQIDTEIMALKIACCFPRIGVKTAQKMFQKSPQIKSAIEIIITEMKKIGKFKEASDDK